MLVLFQRVHFFSKTGHSHFSFLCQWHRFMSTFCIACFGAAWISLSVWCRPVCIHDAARGARMTPPNERLMAVISEHSTAFLFLCSLYLSLWLLLSFDDLICLILHFNFASCSFNQSRCLSGEELGHRKRTHRTLSTVSFFCSLLAIATHTYELVVNK